MDKIIPIDRLKNIKKSVALIKFYSIFASTKQLS